MNSILFCWEMGGGLGHIAKAVLLAERLLDEEVAVHFALRDLAGIDALLPREDYQIHQAPIWHAQLQGMGQAQSYAELMLANGFGSAVGLQGMVRGWQSIIQQAQPGIMICDHAPTALLAAKIFNIPVVLMGHGFFLPPPVTPLPAFQYWKKNDVSRLLQSEQIALQAINQCLSSFKTKPISTVPELFGVQDNFLCTVPALDHYPDVRNIAEITYLGPLWTENIGQLPQWSNTMQKKIFAYLRPNLPGLSVVLAALANSQADVLIHCHGIAADLLKNYTSPSCRFVQGLLNMREVAKLADLVICSGSDTAQGMNCKGVPVMGIPMNVEQQIMCERIRQAGTGAYCLPDSTIDNYATTIHTLLNDVSFSNRTKAFALEHAHYQVELALDHMTDRCLSILNS